MKYNYPWVNTLFENFNENSIIFKYPLDALAAADKLYFYTQNNIPDICQLLNFIFTNIHFYNYKSKYIKNYKIQCIKFYDIVVAIHYSNETYKYVKYLCVLKFKIKIYNKDYDRTITIGEINMYNTESFFSDDYKIHNPSLFKRLNIKIKNILKRKKYNRKNDEILKTMTISNAITGFKKYNIVHDNCSLLENRNFINILNKKGIDKRRFKEFLFYSEIIHDGWYNAILEDPNNKSVIFHNIYEPLAAASKLNYYDSNGTPDICELLKFLFNDVEVKKHMSNQVVSNGKFQIITIHDILVDENKEINKFKFDLCNDKKNIKLTWTFGNFPAMFKIENKIKNNFMLENIPTSL